MARREAAPSLAAVAAAVIEYHEAALEGAHVDVQIVGDSPGEVVVALVRRALSILVGGQVRVAVINQGAIIGADQRPRLYDRFFRGDSVPSDAGSHHGLCFAIVAASCTHARGRPVALSDGDVTTIGLILGAAHSTLAFGALQLPAPKRIRAPISTLEHDKLVILASAN